MDSNNIEELKFWYYIDKGEVTGPFSEEEMLDFYRKHVIEDDTEVWKSGMLDWVKLSSSDLSKKDDPKQESKKNDSNNAIPWILAFLPVLFSGAISRKSLPLLIILLVIHFALGVIDTVILAKEGKAKKTTALLALFLPPVYLAKRVGSPNTRRIGAVVWCLFFAVELFVCTKVIDIPALLQSQRTAEVSETEPLTETGGITVEDFVKAYIRSPKYEIKEGEDGISLFTVNGTMDFEGREAEATITFNVESDGSVHFSEIAVDGITESSDIYYDLIDELKSKME